MSKKELQSELRNRGLPKTGNKDVLKQRLQEQASRRPEQCADSEIIQLEIVGSPDKCDTAVPAVRI